MFEKYGGADPHNDALAVLKLMAQEVYQPEPGDEAVDRDFLIDLLLTEFVQKHLGVGRPTILFDYPASQAALARIRPADSAHGIPAVAERFELYVDGIELANGFHELLDPAELRRRQTEANAFRRDHGLPQLPEESRLLAAMEAGLPPATGVALGFDRLVMIAAGAADIPEVIPFPIDRA